MNLKGKLLELGTVDKCNRIFEKGCDITYPKLIPVAFDYKFRDPESLVGSAFVKRDGDIFTAEVVIYNGESDIDEYLKKNRKVYIGGFYYSVKWDKDHNDGLLHARSANLLGIGIISPEQSSDESLCLYPF